MNRTAFLLLLLLRPLLLAADPVIEGPDRIDAGTFGVLKVSGVDAKSVASWKFRPNVAQAPNQPRGSKCWTAPAGYVGVLEVGIISGSSETGWDITYLEKTLAVGPLVPVPPTPNPVPPGPTPPVPPTPTAQPVAAIVVIEDTAAATAAAPTRNGAGP